MTLLKEYEHSEKKVVVAEMPTGTGKTLIAMAVKQLLSLPAIYICTTKSLQEQFLKDFPYAKLIKGRANYPCGRIPQKFPEVSAEDCLGNSCVVDCPYARAREEARHADLVVANMAYYLNSVQYAPKMFGGRGFVVVDEADTLEDALLEQVSVQISQFDVEKMKLGKPTFKTKWEDWRAWGVEAFSVVRKKEQNLEEELKAYDSEELWATVPTSLIREKKFTSRLAGKMGFFLKHVDQYWVWEQTKAYTRTHQEYWKWVFKPVRVDQFGGLVWENGGKFLAMSATILDQTQYERNVGLVSYREEGQVGGLKVTSSFDPARRPVIVRKGINLTYKHIDANLKELHHSVREILEAHPQDKGVIHAVSYRVAQELKRAFPARVLTHDSRTRLEVIQQFKDSVKPLVLVSPSVDRGEDFPDDICRFIVIVKLPFPYLGDPRVERRLYSTRDGQRWYSLRTISKLIQMTGRGMRHEGDSCTSYILDPSFKKTFLEHRSMFPKWWIEALVWREGGNTDATRGKGEAQGSQGVEESGEGLRGSHGSSLRAPGHSYQGGVSRTAPGIHGSSAELQHHDHLGRSDDQRPELSLSEKLHGKGGW